MESNKKSSNRPPRKIPKYTALEFSVTYNKHKKTVGEIIQLRNSGAISDQDYCFLHEGYMESAAEIAAGWWNNAALQQDPKSRWSLEKRVTMIRDFIYDAFTSKYYGEETKEDG